MRDAQAPTSTTSTTGPSANDTTTDPNATTAKPAVPDAYEFKPPEGQQYAPELLSKATPIFKELGLDQAGAEKLMGIYNDVVKTSLDSAVAMRESWVQAVQNDPAMAGKLDQVKAEIGRFKDTIIGPIGSKARGEFDDAMNLTGAGDHPAIVKAIWKAAQAANEGTHVPGSGPSAHGQTAPNTPPPSAAQRMYPNLPTSH